MCVIVTVAALTAGCISQSPGSAGLSSKRLPIVEFREQDPDITGSVPGRAAATSRQEPAVAALHPPPTAVEIRAQCRMRYEQINAGLDTKTALTQQCVNERLRGAP